MKVNKNIQPSTSRLSQKNMKQIISNNNELLEELAENGINITCNEQMQMVVSDDDAKKIESIVNEIAPDAAYDYTIEKL